MGDRGGVRAHLGLGLSLRPQQRLCPLLVQFTWLLQLATAELEGVVAQELAENPALELPDRPAASFETEWRPPPGGRGERPDGIGELPARHTLREHLRQSLLLPSSERRLAHAIIDEIDDDGYFRGELAEIAARVRKTPAEAERVLLGIQDLPLSGVGARDLRECLLLQLRHLAAEGQGHPLAEALVDEQWDLLSRRRFREAARAAGASLAAVQAAAAFIGEHLLPYPGRAFRPDWGEAPQSSAPPRPDLIIRAAAPPATGFVVEAVEPEAIAVRVSQVYEEALSRVKRGEVGWSAEERAHVAESVARARRFVRHLRQRRETLQRICRAAVERQEAFLRNGRRYLEPLTRLALARGLGLHESTVGRAVAGKWVLLPSRELAPFALFFHRALPAEEAVADLVAREDRRRPWSDQALVGMLAAEGVMVSRRTVARYRRALRIPARSRRRRP